MSDQPESLILNSYERVGLSETSRQLLCSIAAGDPRRPLPHVDADWEEVFDGLVRNGLLGVAHYYLKQQDKPDYPPAEFRQRIERDYRTSCFYSRLMYRRVLPVLSQLNDAGIDYLVVKGPALACSIYPDPTLRPFNDLDILVHEYDWAAVHQQLLDMEFQAVDALPTPPPKLIPQASVQETKYKHPETKLLIEPHYDDVLNAGLAARDVEGFWQRAVKIDIQDVVVRTLSLEDQLVFLCAHAHYHGYTRLNWLTDVALIVRDHAEQIDWHRLIEIVQTEQAQVSVYYTLYFIGQMLDVHAPEWVICAVRPDRFRQFWHEHYLPSDRVISLEPMWRPDFSFYFLPLLKRLIPDLLVMGRRREKFPYLLRLLFPPSEWLRFYYRLEPAAPILPAYVLHPLKLAYHYLVEIASALLHKPQ